MPILGGGGSGSAGSGLDASTAGVWIPAGWGRIWAAARDNHATERVEAVLFGDSTTSGQVASGSNYSWVTRLRERSIAAGYTDGGFGVVERNDTAALTAPDNLIPLSTNSGFGQSDGDNAIGVGSYASTSVGSTITFQFKGTGYRIFYSKRGSGGTGPRLTYRTDGGAKSSVIDASTTSLSFGVAHVSGLEEGTHTVTIEHETGGTEALNVTVEFLRTTGIVYHKHAVPGVTASTWFSPASSTNYRTSAAMGLDLSGAGSSPLWTKAKQSSPTNRNVKLAGFNIGTNDLQSSSSATDASTRADALVNSIGIFAESSKTAGADAFLCIPPFWATSSANSYMGVFRERMLSAGLAAGLAVVDLDAALGGHAAAQAAGYGGASGNPHLTQAGYAAIGDLIFDQIVNRS